MIENGRSSNKKWMVYVAEGGLTKKEWIGGWGKRAYMIAITLAGTDTSNFLYPYQRIERRR